MWRTPLSGHTGMTKNTVKKRIPLFLMKAPWKPQREQWCCPSSLSEPQAKNRVPMINMRSG